MCDVLPLKPCHIILGRPWIWDRDAHHARRANTYSFVEGNKKYTHMCKRHAKFEVKEEFLPYSENCAF